MNAMEQKMSDRKMGLYAEELEALGHLKREVMNRHFIVEEKIEQLKWRSQQVDSLGAELILDLGDSLGAELDALTHMLNGLASEGVVFGEPTEEADETRAANVLQNEYTRLLMRKRIASDVEASPTFKIAKIKDELCEYWQRLRVFDKSLSNHGARQLWSSVRRAMRTVCVAVGIDEVEPIPGINPLSCEGMIAELRAEMLRRLNDYLAACEATTHDFENLCALAMEYYNRTGYVPSTEDLIAHSASPTLDDLLANYQGAPDEGSQAGEQSDEVNAEGSNTETKGGRKDDRGKPRMDLLSPSFLLALGAVLEHGANKYGANNWKTLDEGTERYTAAALRHLMAFMSGETHDQESGLHHLAHASTSLMFLYELECMAQDKECGDE